MKLKHPSYRRKDLFLKPGSFYRVTTHPCRGSMVELSHPLMFHYFEQGTIVKCREVHSGAYGELCGDFISMTGIEQTLSVMDVAVI